MVMNLDLEIEARVIKDRVCDFSNPVIEWILK